MRIHTRIGAETEPAVVEVRDGVPQNADEMLVHFSIPPRRAWDNVHQRCSLVLPFRSQSNINQWCERHGRTVCAGILAQVDRGTGTRDLQ